MLYNLISFTALSMLLTGCAQLLPGLFSAVEDIETQEAITLTMDKEAFQKDFVLSTAIEFTRAPPPVLPDYNASLMESRIWKRTGSSVIILGMYF